MQLTKLADKFQVELLEERTEFYKSMVEIKIGNSEFHWEIETKAVPKGTIEPVMPDLTVLEGVRKVGIDSYIYDGLSFIGEPLSIAVSPIK